ncbi:NADH-ubiquinone oxidoreductase subunit B14.5a [Balamuthia mandrillaris]
MQRTKEEKARQAPLPMRYEDHRNLLDRPTHLSGTKLVGDDLTDTLMEEEEREEQQHLPQHALLSDRKTDLPDTGLGSGHHKYHNIATDIDQYEEHPYQDSNKAQLETVHDARTGAPRVMRKPLNAAPPQQQQQQQQQRQEEARAEKRR